MNYLNNFFIILFVSGMMIGGCLVQIFKVDNLEKSVARLERVGMCNAHFSNESFYVNGLAFGSSYYCVWTKDRTPKQISVDDVHEQCHILIASSNDLKNHFCGVSI